jgi:two-component system phosphate regulon response regulator PhoB
MNYDAVKTKIKLLVIEDELENQKYIELILRQKYSVDFCDDKISMFDLLADENYDAIIMDISLKGDSSGVDLIKEIKKKPSYKNIPIICLSAHTDLQDRVKAEKAGAEIFLNKPVGQKTLLSALDKILSSSRANKKKL